MKKTIIIGALLAGSLSAYSQGTLNFLDREGDMTIHIYAPQVATPSVETTGDANSAIGVTADEYGYNGTDANVFNVAPGGASYLTPVISAGGTTVYTGGAIGNTMAGNATAAGAYNYNNGSDYTVELYAAPGLNAAASALVPVSQYTSTIYTSSSIGGAFKNVTAFTPSDPGMPFAGASATLELVAWYNGGVLPTGLTQNALSAQLAASPVTGSSLLDNFSALYFSAPSTKYDMQGLQSFSLVVSTPEPSTIALGVIGASAFLFRRRK